VIAPFRGPDDGDRRKQIFGKKKPRSPIANDIAGDEWPGPSRKEKRLEGKERGTKSIAIDFRI